MYYIIVHIYFKIIYKIIHNATSQIVNISLQITRCLWYFFLLKILDYIETIVFVLRKKNNQVSTLHLYHHVSTLLLTWTVIRYYALYFVFLMSSVNCFIHSIMYTYYFLAAWGPNVQKTIAPMKQWITIAQMVHSPTFPPYLFISRNSLSLRIISHVRLVI